MVGGGKEGGRDRRGEWERGRGVGVEKKRNGLIDRGGKLLA